MAKPRRRAAQPAKQAKPWSRSTTALIVVVAIVAALVLLLLGAAMQQPPASMPAYNNPYAVTQPTVNPVGAPCYNNADCISNNCDRTIGKCV